MSLSEPRPHNTEAQQEVDSESGFVRVRTCVAVEDLSYQKYNLNFIFLKQWN